jgi:predicted GIY-YIG superfamily endonuclease
MPKLPIDYSNTIIYKLVHKEDYDNANIYIGSTTDYIRRKNNHKNSCNSEKTIGYNDKKYQYIRNNGGWDCFNMIEVEKYNCNDGNEARAREEYWRSHFNSQLNTKRAYRTDEERVENMKQYKQNNKEKIIEQMKKLYEANKENRLEYQKQYYYNKKNKNKTDSSSDSLTERITHQPLQLLFS